MTPFSNVSASTVRSGSNVLMACSYVVPFFSTDSYGPVSNSIFGSCFMFGHMLISKVSNPFIVDQKSGLSGSCDQNIGCVLRKSHAVNSLSGFFSYFGVVSFRNVS